MYLPGLCTVVSRHIVYCCMMLQWSALLLTNLLSFQNYTMQEVA